MKIVIKSAVSMSEVSLESGTKTVFPSRLQYCIAMQKAQIFFSALPGILRPYMEREKSEGKTSMYFQF